MQKITKLLTMLGWVGLGWAREKEVEEIDRDNGRKAKSVSGSIKLVW